MTVAQAGKTRLCTGSHRVPAYRVATVVDGELDPLIAKRVERAIADDPALAAEVERHRALTARLHGNFAKLDVQPMPAGIEVLFTRDNVVALPTRKPAPKPQRWWGAIAASLVAGVLVGQLVPRSDSDLGLEGGTAVAQGNPARALDTQLASTQGTQALQGGAEATTTAYAQAGSPMAAVLEQAQAMAAGDPLDAAGEAAALKGR